MDTHRGAAAPRFGFSEFTTWPWSFGQDLRRYREHGAEVIEVCEFKLPHNDYRMLAELAHSGLAAASVQMKVHSVFVDSMASTPQDPSDRVEAMKRAIAASAPHLPERTPFVVITGVAPDGDFRRAFDRTAEALKELGDFAGERGMRIAFEPLNPVNVHTDTSVWSLAEGLELIERVNDANVGLCIDAWNVWQAPDLAELIAQCASRIFLVQLSDWQRPRSTADRYALGDGEIPLPALMRAIRATGYDGAWVVEILSSLHLNGSLWKGDLDHLLRRNRAAFFALWQQTDAAASP